MGEGKWRGWWEREGGEVGRREKTETWVEEGGWERESGEIGGGERGWRGRWGEGEKGGGAEN